MKLRKRNACLAVIERMRKRCGDVRLSEAISFLYVCENEGINISELAQLTRLSQSSASRAARRLIAKEAECALPPYLGLVELQPQPSDRRGRVLSLTAAGRLLRQEMNDLIVQAAPINLAE